jgi:hypothetical protein
MYIHMYIYILEGEDLYICVNAEYERDQRLNETIKVYMYVYMYTERMIKGELIHILPTN